MSRGRRDRSSDHQRRVERAQAEERRARRQRRLVVIGGSILAVVALGALVVGVVAHSDSGSSSHSAASDTTVRPTKASDFGSTPCPKSDGSSPRRTTFHSPPKLCIDTSATYTATFSTRYGSILVTLDAQSAPVTVNNFVVLALYHYYDGTTLHRVFPDSTIEGGDANGHPPGTGNPGYTISDELPASVAAYQVGSLAMTSKGPHTSASQFLFWLGPKPLDGPKYPLFGQVTSGLEALKAMQVSLSTPSGKPREPVTITSVTIGEARVSSG